MSNRLSRGPYRLLVLAGALASTAIVGRVLASDHQDTPEVELNQNMDINDVYAFPGSTPDRIVLAMTTASPIAGQALSFDSNLLYQIKIDNTGDAIEDLVFQITFNGATGSTQIARIAGPVAPALQGVKGTLVNTSQILEGAVGTNIGSETGIQAFAGLRADPFFIDLEQFFKILPDRRPSTGPLSTPLTQTAQSFRSPGVDLLRPFNALAIVIELPKAQLLSSTAADAKIGVWGTISR
jgi:hypothetical protein